MAVGASHVDPRADASPAGIAERRAGNHAFAAIGQPLGWHRVRIAVKGQMTSVRAEVADLGRESGAEIALGARMPVLDERLLRVVGDELGSTLRVDAGVQHVLDAGAEDRGLPDVDAGEPRVNPEDRATVVRHRQWLVEQAIPRPHDGPPIASQYPAEPESWREALLRRVVEQRRSRSDAVRTGLQVVEAEEARHLAIAFRRCRHELVAQPDAQRQIVADVPVVLSEERQVVLPHVPHRVGARHVARESIRFGFRAPVQREELLQVAEAELAAVARVRTAVEAVPLPVEAGLPHVVPAAPRERVGDLVDVLVVVRRNRCSRAHPGQADHRDRPEVRVLGEIQ